MSAVPVASTGGSSFENGQSPSQDVTSYLTELSNHIGQHYDEYHLSILRTLVPNTLLKTDEERHCYFETASDFDRFEEIVHQLSVGIQRLIHDLLKGSRSHLPSSEMQKL